MILGVLGELNISDPIKVEVVAIGIKE